MSEPAPEDRRKFYPRNINPAPVFGCSFIQKKFIRKYAEREKIRDKIIYSSCVAHRFRDLQQTKNAAAGRKT